jgi:molybdate transport system substrate-binding protein
LAAIEEFDIHIVRHYRTPILRTLLWSLAIGLLLSCGPDSEQVVHVAVAANFTEPAKEIAQLFEGRVGSRAILSFGSTGQLFTQITQGAPFEVFLAADEETPRKAVAADLGLADSVFTYAVGKVVLYSTTLDLTQGETALRQGRFEKLAIANPTTAPYGAAAMQTIKSLALERELAGKIVQGNNITQTFQFVETGNAELGFVALSQVLRKNSKSFWIVPQTLYAPIRQDAVLLKNGSKNTAAHEFISFLKGPDSIKIIEKYGYAGTE